MHISLYNSPLTTLTQPPPPATQILVQLSNFQLLENLCSWEEARINDSCHSESAPHNSADCSEEVVDGWPGLVVPHSDGIKVVSVKLKICKILIF